MIYAVRLNGDLIAAADPSLLDEVLDATGADECVACGELTTRLEEGACCYHLCEACHARAVAEERAR